MQKNIQTMTHILWFDKMRTVRKICPENDLAYRLEFAIEMC